MGAEAPRFVLLETKEDLEGPGDPGDPEAGRALGRQGPLAVTGGGLAALVDPVRGLLGVWRGEEQVAGALTLHLEGGPGRDVLAPTTEASPTPAAVLRPGPGSWERTLALPGGGSLTERGLAPEVDGGLVVQWTLSPDARSGGAALSGSLAVPDGTQAPLPPLPLRPGEGRKVLLVLPGVDPRAAARRLGPLPARELGRRRDGDEGWGFGLKAGGEEAPWLPEALALLDDAPLALDEEGRPRAPFLAGVREGGPAFLQGTALAEVGLGALLTGRRPLARAILEALAREPEGPPPLHFLFLAARWAHWTGGPEALLSVREALDTATDRLLDGLGAGPGPGVPDRAPAGSAFPSPGRVLELLADGLEPLGEARWSDGLRARVGKAREARSASGVPGGRRSLSLPVLGQASIDPESAGNETAPSVPPPEAFGAPNAPGHRHAATLRAARLLRAWVEGVLGAEADAAYGRLTLAPRIEASTEDLRLRGLRAGDGSVSFDCRRRGPSFRFLLRQDRGRVPLNLIFAPRLPLREVAEVRIGDRTGEVEVTEEPDGLVVRCQFPLDPERRITIVGTD